MDAQDRPVAAVEVTLEWTTSAAGAFSPGGPSAATVFTDERGDFFFRFLPRRDRTRYTLWLRKPSFRPVSLPGEALPPPGATAVELGRLLLPPVE